MKSRSQLEAESIAKYKSAAKKWGISEADAEKKARALLPSNSDKDLRDFLSKPMKGLSINALDPAHAATDKELQKMEREVSKVYNKAAESMRDKIAKYLDKFADQDVKMQEQLKAGDITESEYKEWKTRKLIRTEKWGQMRDVLAEDASHANDIAKSVINGHMPDVYAENYNFAVYEIEKGLKAKTTFTLYDHHTAERLLRKDQKLLPKGSSAKAKAKDIKWNQKQIQGELLQGILQGESNQTIAKRMQNVTGANRKASMRYARTMTTAAENAGRNESYKDAEGMGISMEKTWMATLDERTRDSHRLLDGETIPVDETFSNGCDYPGDPDGDPEEVYNCFVGDTLVASDSDIEKLYTHEYEGELVTIKTASGINFTCTPNHPILTPNGWVKANSFNEGDNILVALCGDIGTARINPHVNHVFTRINTVSQLLDELGRKRTSALRVNFHGDIPTSDVEVITFKRFLRNNRNSGKPQTADKLRFKFTDKTFVRKGTLMKHFGRICFTSLRLMRGICKPFAFFRGCLSHSCVHTFRPVADMDIVLPEYSINDLPAETMIRGELLDGLTGKIFVDNVVSVERCIRKCHVYNLQTENGYYFVNSIINDKENICNDNAVIAKNCRCTMVTQIKGFARSMSDMGWRSNKGLGGMSYEDWKSGRDAEEEDEE